MGKAKKRKAIHREGEEGAELRRSEEGGERDRGDSGELNEEELLNSVNMTKAKKSKKSVTQGSLTNKSPASENKLQQEGGKGEGDQWNFEVEYNDHFETPQQAYVDLLQVLKHAAKDARKALTDLVVYDPYYCNGRVVSLLNNLGIRNIINRNRDFYQDIRSRSLPEFDILVTNPPYSGEHKQQLLEYLRTITKPFALLLPAYTATKAYWRNFVQQENLRWKVKGPFDSVIYLLPPSSYEYSHPEGTGKDLPPFYSAWFVGGSFSSRNELRSSCLLAPAGTPLPPSCSHHCLTVLANVDALISRGYVTDSAKRPNPKQRKKMKQKQQKTTTALAP